MLNNKSMLKRRIHDGIAGALITIGLILGYSVADGWYLLSLIIGLLMIQSSFTSFCPVYFTLDKLMKD